MPNPFTQDNRFGGFAEANPFSSQANPFSSPFSELSPQQAVLEAARNTNQAPILDKPKIQNPDGTFSTERTITIGPDPAGQFFNIPTIVDGRPRSENEAIQLFKEGKNPPVGTFDSLEQAVSAAKQRSQEIGRLSQEGNGFKEDLNTFLQNPDPKIISSFRENQGSFSTDPSTLGIFNTPIDTDLSSQENFFAKRLDTALPSLTMSILNRRTEEREARTTKADQASAEQKFLASSDVPFGPNQQFKTPKKNASGFLGVIDYFNIFNWMIAGLAKDIIGGEPGFHPIKRIANSLSGKERASFIDVLEEEFGAEPGVTTLVIGLALDILLDPLTYAGGAGAFTKAGKAVKLFGEAGKAAEILGKTTKLSRVGRLIGESADATSLLDKGTKALNPSAVRRFVAKHAKNVDDLEATIPGLQKQFAEASTATEKAILKESLKIIPKDVKKMRKLLKRYRRAADVIDKTPAKALRLGETAAEQATLGQRSLLSLKVGIPFTEAFDAEKIVVRGTGVFKAARQAKQYFSGTKVGRFLGTKFVSDSFTMIAKFPILGDLLKILKSSGEGGADLALLERKDLLDAIDQIVEVNKKTHPEYATIIKQILESPAIVQDTLFDSFVGQKSVQDTVNDLVKTYQVKIDIVEAKELAKVSKESLEAGKGETVPIVRISGNSTISRQLKGKTKKVATVIKQVLSSEPVDEIDLTEDIVKILGDPNRVEPELVAITKNSIENMLKGESPVGLVFTTTLLRKRKTERKQKFEKLTKLFQSIFTSKGLETFANIDIAPDAVKAVRISNLPVKDEKVILSSAKRVILSQKAKIDKVKLPQFLAKIKALRETADEVEPRIADLRALTELGILSGLKKEDVIDNIVGNFGLSKDALTQRLLELGPLPKVPLDQSIVEEGQLLGAIVDSVSSDGQTVLVSLPTFGGLKLSVGVNELSKNGKVFGSPELAEKVAKSKRNIDSVIIVNKESARALQKLVEDFRGPGLTERLIAQERIRQESLGDKLNAGDILVEPFDAEVLDALEDTPLFFHKVLRKGWMLKKNWKGVKGKPSTSRRLAKRGRRFTKPIQTVDRIGGRNAFEKSAGPEVYEKFFVEFKESEDLSATHQLVYEIEEFTIEPKFGGAPGKPVPFGGKDSRSLTIDAHVDIGDFLRAKNVPEAFVSFQKVPEPQTYAELAARLETKKLEIEEQFYQDFLRRHLLPTEAEEKDSLTFTAEALQLFAKENKSNRLAVIDEIFGKGNGKRFAKKGRGGEDNLAQLTKIVKDKVLNRKIPLPSKLLEVLARSDTQIRGDNPFVSILLQKFFTASVPADQAIFKKDLEIFLTNRKRVLAGKGKKVSPVKLPVAKPEQLKSQRVVTNREIKNGTVIRHRVNKQLRSIDAINDRLVDHDILNVVFTEERNGKVQTFNSFFQLEKNGKLTFLNRKVLGKQAKGLRIRRISKEALDNFFLNNPEIAKKFNPKLKGIKKVFTQSSKNSVVAGSIVTNDLREILDFTKNKIPFKALTQKSEGAFTLDLVVTGNKRSIKTVIVDLDKLQDLSGEEVNKLLDTLRLHSNELEKSFNTKTKAFGIVAKKTPGTEDVAKLFGKGTKKGKNIWSQLDTAIVRNKSVTEELAEKISNDLDPVLKNPLHAVSTTDIKLSELGESKAVQNKGLTDIWAGVRDKVRAVGSSRNTAILGKVPGKPGSVRILIFVEEEIDKVIPELAAKNLLPIAKFGEKINSPILKAKELENFGLTVPTRDFIFPERAIRPNDGVTLGETVIYSLVKNKNQTNKRLVEFLQKRFPGVLDTKPAQFTRIRETPRPKVLVPRVKQPIDIVNANKALANLTERSSVLKRVNISLGEKANIRKGRPLETVVKVSIDARSVGSKVIGKEIIPVLRLSVLEAEKFNVPLLLDASNMPSELVNFFKGIGFKEGIDKTSLIVIPGKGGGVLKLKKFLDSLISSEERIKRIISKLTTATKTKYSTALRKAAGLAKEVKKLLKVVNKPGGSKAIKQNSLNKLAKVEEELAKQRTIIGRIITESDDFISVAPTRATIENTTSLAMDIIPENPEALFEMLPDDLVVLTKKLFTTRKETFEVAREALAGGVAPIEDFLDNTFAKHSQIFGKQIATMWEFIIGGKRAKNLLNKKYRGSLYEIQYLLGYQKALEKNLVKVKKQGMSAEEVEFFLNLLDAKALRSDPRIRNLASVIQDALGEVNPVELYETGIAPVLNFETVNVVQGTAIHEFLKATVNEGLRLLKGGEETFVKLLEYGPNGKAKVPDGYMILKHPLFKTKDGTAKYLVDIEVGKGLKALEPYVMGEKSIPGAAERFFRNWWDPQNNLFKQYTLFLFPEFFTRNIGTSMFATFMSGTAAPARILKARRFIDGTAGKESILTVDGLRSAKEIMAESTVTTIRGKGASKEVFAAAENLANTKEAIGPLRKKALAALAAPVSGALAGGPLGFAAGLGVNSLFDLKKVFAENQTGPAFTRLREGLWNQGWWRTHKNPALEVGRRLQTRLEDIFRVATYIDAREQGLSIQAAADKVVHFHFDYTDLTSFEKTTARRIFPFYTWLRKNIPLWIQESVGPGRQKILLLAKGKQAVTKSQRDLVNEEFVPEWVQENLGIPVGRDKDGNTRFFLLGGWLAIADLQKLTNPIDLAVNSLSPAIKAPIEQAVNYNFFFKSQIARYPGEPGRFLGTRPSKRTLQLLRNVRALQSLDKLNPLGVFNRDGRQNRVPEILRWLKVATGINVNTIDASKQKFFKIQSLKFQRNQLKGRFNKAVRIKDIEAMDVLRGLIHDLDANILRIEGIPVKNEFIPRKRTTRNESKDNELLLKGA